MNGPEVIMSQILRVFVAGKPASVNKLYAARRGTYAKRLDPEAQVWLNTVAIETMRWRFPERMPRPRLAVHLTLVGIRANADIDNYAKTILDGLKLGIAVDDRYIHRLVIERGEAAYKGQRGAWIEVWRLPMTVAPTRAERAERRGRLARIGGDAA